MWKKERLRISEESASLLHKNGLSIIRERNLIKAFFVVFFLKIKIPRQEARMFVTGSNSDVTYPLIPLSTSYNLIER